MKYKTFTVKSEGIDKYLISDCGISAYHNPFAQKVQPPINIYSGLWDTGAAGTVISSKIVKELDLKPCRKAKVTHAHGESIANVYCINIFLPSQIAFTFVTVTEGKLGDGIDVLIGMDIITMGDFAVSNFNNITTFSFRVPSVGLIDFNSDH